MTSACADIGVLLHRFYSSCILLPDQNNRSSICVVNDVPYQRSTVMALLKQSCCAAGRFSATNLWLNPRSTSCVSISLTNRVLSSLNTDAVAKELTANFTRKSRAFNFCLLPLRVLWRRQLWCQKCCSSTQLPSMCDSVKVIAHCSAGLC